MSLKHAYLIMAHNDFDTLGVLINLLDYPNNDIFLHIDSKSMYSIDNLRAKMKHSNIFEIQRMDVCWADYSQVECEMNLFSESAKGKYDYYHIMSGADLPLKKQSDIQDFFEKNSGKEFVHYYGGSMDDIFENFVSKYHFFQKKLARTNGKKINIIIKALNKASLNLQKIFKVNRLKNDENVIKKGCNWVSVSHEFVIYLLSKSEYIEERFKSCRSPDEFFVQTVLFNSKFKNNLFVPQLCDNYYGCLRYIDWSRSNPYVFRNSDFNELINSGYIFARKFNSNVDQEIIFSLSEYTSE